MDKPNSNLKTTVGIYSKRGGIQTITALIPAKDEEKNIAKCIESLKWCDRIIVLWMGTDRTGKIAQKMGVEVVKKILQNTTTLNYYRKILTGQSIIVPLIGYYV